MDGPGQRRDIPVSAEESAEATPRADGRPDAAPSGRTGNDRTDSGRADIEHPENDQPAPVASPPEGSPPGPPLAGRVHYLIGGTLPPRYNDWVSHDLTGPGWRLRQALRPFLLMVPFAIMFALLPGQVSVRVTLVVFLLLAGIGLGFATSGYFRNRRLEQHGFPPVFPPSDDD